jgi:hypothetical protein
MGLAVRTSTVRKKQVININQLTAVRIKTVLQTNQLTAVRTIKKLQTLNQLTAARKSQLLKWTTSMVEQNGIEGK